MRVRSSSFLSRCTAWCPFFSLCGTLVACSTYTPTPPLRDSNAAVQGGSSGAARPSGQAQAGAGTSGDGMKPAAQAGSGGAAAAGRGGAADSGGQGGAGRSSSGAGGSAVVDAGQATAADDAGEPDPSNVGRGVGRANATGATLSAAIEMQAIPAGAESHQCVVVELPNTAPLWVTSLRGTLTDGSHHLIVDRFSAASGPLQLEAESCPPTMGGDETRLLIVQQRDTTLKLPSGVAYRIEPKQRIRLQLHYINSGDEPKSITGKVELATVDVAATFKEAKSVFTGAVNILIPARQSLDIAHFQSPNPSGTTRRVFALTSHTHKLGVRATIERVPDLDAPETRPLHESTDWAEPPLTVFDTPLTFSGADGLRLTCRYQNTTDRNVTFGTGVDDEMCFMWMYFYDE